MKTQQTGQPSAAPGARAGIRRFLVYNVTDAVLAYPDLMTLAEARAFIRCFPGRFGGQGHYRTASGERISPEGVELEIVDAGAIPPLRLRSVAQPVHRGW